MRLGEYFRDMFPFIAWGIAAAGIVIYLMYEYA